MDGYNRGKPLTGLLGRTLPGSFFSGQPGPRQTYQQGPTRTGGVTGGNMEHVPAIRPDMGRWHAMTPQRPGSWTNHFYNLIRRNGFGGF